MKHLIFACLDRICIVIGFLIFSQAPLFIEQYCHRLAGHVEELQFQIGITEKLAKQSGKTTKEYIEKFLYSEDMDYMSQGKFLKEMRDRLIKLQFSYRKIKETSFWMKPFVFFSFIDQMILKGTWKNFQPGLSFSYETCVFACFGMALGWCLFFLIRLMIKGVLKEEKCLEKP